MSSLMTYEDDKVAFSYPPDFKLKVSSSSGQYYLRRSKDNVVSISVMPAAVMEGTFDSMVSAPIPRNDRRKAVHQKFTLGEKEGCAIDWEILGDDMKPLMRSLQFFFDSDPWTVLIEVMTRPPATSSDFEEIVRSFRLKDGPRRP